MAKIWTSKGAATPLKFIVAWAGGLLLFSALGVHAGIFQAYQAVLAIAAWFVAKATG
jgi:hypothetical protein